jgi:hypothetical protein
VESNGAAPANVYAFSKVIMDNIARRAAAESADWTIVGLRYFNVYGPCEAHKGVPASMIYHLAQQMKAGKRPRIFKHGEQKRDFVYVKDVWAQIFSPNTSIIRTRIIKTSRKPILPAREMRSDTSRSFRSKTACAITCSAYIRPNNTAGHPERSGAQSNDPAT